MIRLVAHMGDPVRRPVIFMQPGPIHLFWVTGVFYFWDLAKKFDFVFLVPANYQQHTQFQKIASLPAVKHIEYIPEEGILSRHFRYKKIFRTLLQEYVPQLILLHNWSYLGNQYLLELCAELTPKASRFYFQNCRFPLMWEGNFAALRDVRIEPMLKSNRLFAYNPKLVGVVNDLRCTLSFLIHYKLFPLLVLGKVLHPPVNVMTGYVDRAAAIASLRAGKDFVLAYLAEEIEAYKSQGFESVICIHHPMRNAGKQVFQFLYEDISEQDAILILPSYGFTSQLIVQGWSESQVVDHVGGKWCNAMDALLARFPGYRLTIKLHPASKNDPSWKRIIERIIQAFPQVINLPSSESAELCVVKSRVVVSDVSTVLWWAALWGGKSVISLDVFGYPGGGEMKLYSNYIEYINDISKINASSFSGHDLSSSGAESLHRLMKCDE